jgi:hypothetical protein
MDSRMGFLKPMVKSTEKGSLSLTVKLIVTDSRSERAMPMH